MPAAGALISAGGIAAGGAGSFFGGKEQSKSARKASSDQLQAAREAIAAQREGADKAAEVFREQNREARDFLEQSFERARQDVAPFRDIQLEALNRANALADPNSSATNAQRNFATKQVQRQLASQGLLRSGRQAGVLADVEQNFAEQQFNRANQLANLGAAQQLGNLDVQLGAALAQNAAGLGQNLGSLFGNLGSNIGNVIQTGAAGAAQATLQAGQARAQTLAGINNAFQAGGANFLAYQNQLNNQRIQQQNLDLYRNLFSGSGGTVGTTGTAGVPVSPFINQG